VGRAGKAVGQLASPTGGLGVHPGPDGGDFVLCAEKVAGFAEGNDDTPLELLTNFREMKLQGDISDKEFRTIKALLNEKQAPSVNHNQDAT